MPIPAVMVLNPFPPVTKAVGIVGGDGGGPSVSSYVVATFTVWRAAAAVTEFQDVVHTTKRTWTTSTEHQP